MYSMDSTAKLISKCSNGLTNGTVVPLCSLWIALLHLYLNVVMDKLMVL